LREASEYNKDKATIRKDAPKRGYTQNQTMRREFQNGHKGTTAIQTI